MVQIDDDVFIDMLWERVSTFAPNVYTDEFWGEVLERRQPEYYADNYIYYQDCDCLPFFVHSYVII